MLKAATVAAPLGLYDCCGVSDGAACAIVTTPAIARALRPAAEVVTIKALELSVSNGEESGFHRWDGAHIVTAREAGARQLHQVDRGLTHNLGGHPQQNVCAVSTIGRQGT